MTLGQLSSFLPNISKAKVAATDVFDILDRRSLVDYASMEGVKPSQDSLRGEIAFRRTRFCYPSRPSIRVLDDVDIRVEPGQTVALVGSSGSGKSTCMSLLERFYDVDAGDMLAVDAVNVVDWNLAELRRQFGLVSQEPALFSRSILENITYGKPGASQTEVEQAARLANVHEFIQSLPGGYNTQIGERGTLLSGGHKQRIAIARAMVRNPNILLLDEATSALDTESETLVQEALDKARKGRSCLVIAHRLSTIRDADVIYVLQDGRVVEKGTHEELFCIESGIYKSLVIKQTLSTSSL